MGLQPSGFVREKLQLSVGLSAIREGLNGAEMPNVVTSSLITSAPIVLPPLLQPVQFCGSNLK